MSWNRSVMNAVAGPIQEVVAGNEARFAIKTISPRYFDCGVRTDF
jgi:hypothetical protein